MAVQMRSLMQYTPRQVRLGRDVLGAVEAKVFHGEDTTEVLVNPEYVVSIVQSSVEPTGELVDGKPEFAKPGGYSTVTLVTPWGSGDNGAFELSGELVYVRGTPREVAAGLGIEVAG